MVLISRLDWSRNEKPDIRAKQPIIVKKFDFSN